MNPKVLIHDFYKIFKILKTINPDAVIGFYLLHAFPLILLKKLLGFKLFVVATGGDVNLHNGFFYRTVRKLVCTKADLVFTVSADLQDKLNRECGISSILMPSGIDPSYFKKINTKISLRQNWNLNENDIVILTVGNLVKHKGIHVLLNAARILQNTLQKTSLRLLIVGDGPEKDTLRKHATSFGLNDSVVFLGYRSRSELLELYNICDIFVLPSYSEGLPFVLLEAMACECICVSTPVGDISKVICDGYNGFLCVTGDHADLADKIVNAISLTFQDRQKVGKNARSTIENRYDLRNITKEMIRIVVKYLSNV